MEPGTGIATLGTLMGSKEIVVKLLGPTADYLGGELKTWAERGTKNVGRIFQKASGKLGSRLDEPGAVRDFSVYVLEAGEVLQAFADLPDLLTVEVSGDEATLG